jgi:hypothetical protein
MKVIVKFYDGVSYVVLVVLGGVIVIVLSIRPKVRGFKSGRG